MLTLGSKNMKEEWQLQRIGTESEKSSVEKELFELHESLASVEQWHQKRLEVEEQLKKVRIFG